MSLIAMTSWANTPLPSACLICPPPFGIGDVLSDLLDEPEMFEAGSSSFQIGIGFRSDVNLKIQAQELNQLDTKMLIPALSLTYEKNVWNNLGVGITLATQIWDVPVFNYQYRYYSGGLRATYHLNVNDKVDTYFGGGVSYRYMSLTNRDAKNSNGKINGTWLLGARYYPGNRMGAFLEIGNDALTWFKTGITYYIP